MNRTETLLASVLETNNFRVVSVTNSIGRVLRPVPLKSATYKRPYAHGELILTYQNDAGNEAIMNIKVVALDTITFTVNPDGTMTVKTDYYTVELS